MIWGGRDATFQGDALLALLVRNWTGLRGDVLDNLVGYLSYHFATRPKYERKLHAITA